jgi:hypothetical protein
MDHNYPFTQWQNGVNAHLEQRGIMTVPDVDLRVLAATDNERLVAPAPWGVRDAQDRNALRPLLPPPPIL